MSGKLSTHILDLTTGAPAGGMTIELWHHSAKPKRIKIVITNADGRTDAPLLDVTTMAIGSYEITFWVADYFTARGVACTFLDRVPIRFTITDLAANYHVPLLVTPWAYNTYRGS